MGYTSGSLKTGESNVRGTAGHGASLSSSVYGQGTDVDSTKIDYIDLAIAVLKTQDPSMIHSLTDFLMALSTPSQIEEILQDAVAQLAQKDSKTHQWILDHCGCLMPYIDLLHGQAFESNWGHQDSNPSVFCGSKRAGVSTHSDSFAV